MAGQQVLGRRQIRGSVLLSAAHGYFLVVDDNQIESLSGFGPAIQTGWKRCFAPVKPQNDLNEFLNALRLSVVTPKNTPN